MLVCRGINIYVLNFAGRRLDLTTASGRAFVGVLAVFAELESGLVSERTKEAMAHLKESGMAYHGWPPGPTHIDAVAKGNSEYGKRRRQDKQVQHPASSGVALDVMPDRGADVA